MRKKVRLKGRLKRYLQASLLMGVLLALLNICMFTIDLRAGLLVFAFLVFYFIVMSALLFYNKPIIMNELISFATQYGQIQRKLLRDLELPHALLDDEGKVIWTNKAFENVVHKEKGFKKTIGTLFPEITKDKLPGSERNETEIHIEYETRNYVAKFKKIPLQEIMDHSDILETTDYDTYLVAAYLFDETALRFALQENDDQSLAVGLIYLDNYEEALDSIEEVRRSLLIALIDRKVNKYIASIDGIVKKLEKDKYLVVLRKKALKQLQEVRFDLLEEVKTVNIGNEMSVTLSIGIGLDGLTYSQNYEFARTSIDLALGRGGDQAVVKTPESLTYYGGKSQQVEKNTRVKARVKAHALREIISTKDNVIVMGHRMTDVDSFGAAVGVYCIARTLERRAHIVINEPSSSVKPLQEMFLNSDYEEDMFLTSQQAIEVAESNTVLVVVDVNRPAITECPELLRICKSIVVLDHHRQGAETIENATLSYVEPYASSACEMVAEILQYIGDGVKIRNNEADSLYAGIIIDTNSFVAKTGVRTFEAAAFLRRSGADVTRVRKLFREDANEYKAKAEAVRHAELYRGEYALSVCPAEHIESPTIVGAQAANELLDIKGVKASFVFTDYQGKIYISARSIDEVNVQVITEKIGGGGHMNIAGAQLEGYTVEAAMDLMRNTLDTMVEEGELE